MPKSNVKLPLVVLSDCDPLVLKCVGKSEVPEFPTEPSDVAVARVRWLHYLVEHRLPFCRAHPEELMIHRPRAVNSVADWVCNLILNEGADEFLWINPDFIFVPEGWVAAYSDGAYRSSGAGMASCGAVIEFHIETPEPASVIVAVKGLRLSGCSDSFLAEAEGAILAIELLVEVFKRTTLWN